MPRVHQAQPYRENALGSFGDATYMLIRQRQFPKDTYDERDTHEGRDSDRIDVRLYQSCFERYVQTVREFQNWVKGARDEDIFILIKALLRASDSVTWTGYRVLGSVHRGNGYAIWTFELFAKHPDSATIVTDGTPANDDPAYKKPRCIL